MRGPDEKRDAVPATSFLSTNFLYHLTVVQDKSEWAFFGQVSDCFYTMPSGRLKSRLHWPKMLSKSWMIRKIGPFIAQHIPKSWDSGDSKRT